MRHDLMLGNRVRTHGVKGGFHLTGKFARRTNIAPAQRQQDVAPVPQRCDFGGYWAKRGKRIEGRLRRLEPT